jgi:hypothetical protein
LSPLPLSTKERLLAAMVAGRLVVVCGAGLSMAAPSQLPSAVGVSRLCFDRYQLMNPAIPIALRDDLEGLADYFLDLHMLHSHFIAHLVPWARMIGVPNSGHEAIADFLLTGTIDYVFTTNFDWLIERAGEELGAYLIASLTAGEANAHEAHHRPILKAHGCGRRDPDQTVWTRRQLAIAPVAPRVSSIRDWLAARLPNRDLLVLGFWTDWAYFTQALETCLSAGHPATVTVVDLASDADLQARGAALWAVLHAGGVAFEHIQLSAAEVLQELREEISRMYVRHLLGMGFAAYQVAFGVPCPADWLSGNDIPTEHLYAVRRDAEGVSVSRPARQRTPPATAQTFGFFLLALRHVNAQREGPLFRLQDGRTVRLVNGAGRWMREIEEEYAHEPPAGVAPDLVACIGSIDYGVPVSVVRSGRSASVVRSGSRGTWLDDSASRALVGL